MARAKTIDREAPRRGRFSWFALLLLIVSLVGLILALRPKSVESMWKKTLSDLQKREGVLLFAQKALQNGTLTVSGTGEGALSAEAVFALPEGASLFVDGEEPFLLTAGAENVTLSQGESASSAPRSHALASYDASHFAGETDALALSLRRFLLLAQTREDPAEIFAPYEKALKRNLPRATREKVETEEGGETRICYELDAKRLSAILTEWQRTLPGDVSLRQYVSDLIRALYALQGESAPQGLIDQVNGILAGTNGEQALLATGLAAGKGNVNVTFRAAGDRIVGIDAAWELPFGGAESQGEAHLDLGRRPAKAARRSFSFRDTRTQGSQIRALSLTLKDETVENSGNAFVREAEMSFEDAGFRLLPAAEGDDGIRTARIKYSWGKKRGDMGLRVATERQNVQFRCELKDYKAGKRAEIILRRVEVDGENRIADQSYTLLLRLGGTPAEAAPGEMDLFRETEEETAETPAGAEAVPAL